MNEERKIYGYDSFHHEKSYFSVDYLIDNYKSLATETSTFRIFHSEKERDQYAIECLRDDGIFAMESKKEQNLDAEWAQTNDEVLS
tara:strand:+ start:43 stop:300 length:258 start_codon:yes stop_codon:yes gene_type:complete